MGCGLQPQSLRSHHDAGGTGTVFTHRNREDLAVADQRGSDSPFKNGNHRCRYFHLRFQRATGNRPSAGELRLDRPIALQIALDFPVVVVAGDPDFLVLARNNDGGGGDESFSLKSLINGSDLGVRQHALLSPSADEIFEEISTTELDGSED